MAGKQAAKRPKKQRATLSARGHRVRRAQADAVAPGKLPVISEADFLASVTQLANLSGWLVYHTYDSRRSQAGFPDLVLARNGQLIFAELKTNKGRVKAAQTLWLDTLSQVPGIGVYLWRPRDWDGIEKILTS